MGRFDELASKLKMVKFMPEEEEFAKKIWNAAIEAAAKECDRIFLTDNMRIVVSDEIRRLKK